MKLLQRLAATALSLAAPSVALAGGGADWIADYDKAVEAAKAQKKDLLVDFTGSDWCGWCKKLDAEVFSKKEFLDAATRDYVLVSLDFPRDAAVKAKVPNPARNDELAQKHGIQGFPTILMMTVDGEVYARTGYQEGGPVKYVESLNKLREKGRRDLAEVKEIVAKFGAALGEEKNILLDRALRTLEGLEAESPFAASLVPVARTALVSDADNAQGRKLRAVKALLKSGEYDDELEKHGRELDPKNEQGVLERLVFSKLNRMQSESDVRDVVAQITEVEKLGIRDASLEAELYSAAAFLSFQYLDDKDGAKAWAEKLKLIAGDDEKFRPLFDMVLG